MSKTVQSAKCRKDRLSPQLVSCGKLVAYILDGYLAEHMRCRATCGGAYRDRTDDLKLAKLALSQLS